MSRATQKASGAGIGTLTPIIPTWILRWNVRAA